MVVKCLHEYPAHQEEAYRAHFDVFPFPLSTFQKHAIQAIVDGHHTLVTAHTGSGKTLPIEFAIRHFIPQGKRLVYLGPLKSLVDQKFYDFSKKFPDVTFGIMTSDIKYQPNAQVLIMTTEIFMNYLFTEGMGSQDQDQKSVVASPLGFGLDLTDGGDLACVVFDEVHFILDEQRGHVWEKTLLLLPPHIQLILLSATLDDPVKLATFVERRHLSAAAAVSKKQVVLSTTTHRVVPLNHFAYVIAVESLFKKAKDKETQAFVRGAINRLLLLKREDGEFQEMAYHTVKQVKQLLDHHRVEIKRSHVLNSLALFLTEQQMLPAIFFTFSRKNVEAFARELTTNVLEFDSKIPYTARREAEQIVRRLPNYAEYLALPEYETLVGLLEKGVAMHHSGMIPILREIVELFIERQMVKILVATDSFSVGLNCAIKTTVFTAMRKFDGVSDDYLPPHLYSQCAGRAGRRGMDTVGYVIHCANLFDLPTVTEYKHVLCGKPQRMMSRFAIDYSVILHPMKQGAQRVAEFEAFVSKSMMVDELERDKTRVSQEMAQWRAVVEAPGGMAPQTPPDILERYLGLKSALGEARTHKKRKEIERAIQEVETSCKPGALARDLGILKKRQAAQKALDGAKEEWESIITYIPREIRRVLALLERRGCIERNGDGDEGGGGGEEAWRLTPRGRMASQITESNGLVVAEWLSGQGGSSSWSTLSVTETVGILSCFCDVRVKEEMRRYSPSGWSDQEKDKKERPSLARVQAAWEQLYHIHQWAENLEDDLEYRGRGRASWTFDLAEESMAWAEANDEMACKAVLQSTSLMAKGVSAGDFVKAMQKIAAVAKEWMGVCEQEGLVDGQHMMAAVGERVLKYICTNQSLYVWAGSTAHPCPPPTSSSLAFV